MTNTRQKKVALYARVSRTDGQTVENQLLELRAAAERNGWVVKAEYVDEGFSGAKGRDKRPGFDCLLRAVNKREIDGVMTWAVDRLGRSLQDLCAFLADLHAKSTDLYVHVSGIDTSTPGGRAMFQLFGVFAEFERALIVERTKAGLERARAQGKRLGRPRVPGSKRAEVRKLLATGMGVVRVAKTLGVGVSTVQSVRREIVP